MAMSEEARKAAGERMAAGRAAARAAKAAGSGVAVLEREPEMLRPDGQAAVSFSGAERVTMAERFAARIAAQGTLTTNDDLAAIAGNDASVLGQKENATDNTVQRTGPGLVWMFRHEPWGWKRGKYSRNDVAMLLNSGFLDRCGDCGLPDCPGEVNQCPAAERLGKMHQYIDCPVPACNEGRGRRIYDTGEALVSAVTNDDPLAIKGVYANSTPALRLKVMMDDHIRYFHTQYAAAIGLVVVRTTG